MNPTTEVKKSVGESVAYWKERGYKILVVNLPITGEWMFKRFFISFLRVACGDVYNYLLAKHKVKIMVDIVSDFPIDHNRNKAISNALDVFDADYIMCMDADQSFDQYTLPRLMEAMEQKAPDGSDVEVVAGMYFHKSPPFRAVLGTYVSWDKDLAENEAYLDKFGFVCHGECGDPKHSKGTHQLIRYQSPHYWPQDKLYRADVIGVGCVLTRRSMWEKLKMPYFNYSPDPIHGKEKNDAREVSEDMYWCAQMHKAGVKVWINPGVQCGHIGVIEADRSIYEGHFKAAREHVAKLPDDSKVKKEFFEHILDLR